MNASLFLRLAGPAQSWAGRNGMFPDQLITERTPTRRGVLGLLAACLGISREQLPEWRDKSDVVLTVRVDLAGTVVNDFQTVNPLPARLARMHLLASEAPNRLRPPVRVTEPRRFVSLGTFGDGTRIGDGSTHVTRREFLAGARFTVQVDRKQGIDEFVSAVRSPKFVPYLGRKAFSPTFPFFLGTSEEPDVLSRMPVTADPDHPGETTRELPVGRITGDSDFPDPRGVTVPVVSEQEEQSWLLQHLSR